MPGRRALLAFFGYLIVTCALGFVWHLVLFEGLYRKLEIYSRLDDPIFALGLLSMAIQGVVLTALYPRFQAGGPPLWEGLRFGLWMGLFFGSGSVVAEVAKQRVTSLPLWFALAGTFTLIHFTIVGLLFGAIYSRRPAS
jgi:hypothetical protein